MPLQPGEKAPDFNLPAHTGQNVSLSNYKGRRVIVAFHPATFTGGCQIQVKGFKENYEEFKKLGAEILEISTDSVHSQKVWAEQLGGMPYPLLADNWPHGATGKAYGVLNEERGTDRRSVFLVDSNGVVRWSKVYEPGTLPDSNEILPEIKKIS